MVRCPFPCRLAALLALGAMLAAAAPSRAEGQAAPPSGLEGVVMDLVMDPGDRSPLPRDYGVIGAEIGIDTITVLLSGPGGELLVALHDPDSEPEGVVAHTPSFAVVLASGAEVEGADSVVAAFARRVTAADDGSFWEHVAAEAPPSPHSYGGASPSTLVDQTRRAVGWAGLALVLLISAVVQYRRGKPRARARARRFAATALVAVALALRLTVPPWAPIHSNDHGVAELRGLSGATTGTAHEARQYGSAYLDVVRPLAALTGDDAHFALALAALFGALTVLGLYLLARRLFPGRPAVAFLAATALALDPAHVRLSLSESPRVLAMLLLVVGLVFGVAALGDAPRRLRLLFAWGAALALGLSAELRAVTLYLPFAGALFIAIGFTHGHRPRAVLGLFAGPALWALFAVYGHGQELAPMLRAAWSRDPGSGAALGRRVSPFWSPANILFDAAYTPVIVGVIAGLGAIALAALRRWRLLVACIVAWLPICGPALWVRACRTDTLRTQTDLHLPLALLAGAAVLLLPRDHPRSRPFAAFLLAILAIGSVPGLIDAAQGDVQSASYRAAIEGAPAPPGLIAVAPATMTDERVHTEFPDYAVADPTRIRDGRGTGECMVFVGVSCWSFAMEENLAAVPRVAGGPFRRECADLLGGPEASEAAVSALPIVAVPHRAGELHEIPAENPRIGYAPCAPP